MRRSRRVIASSESSWSSTSLTMMNDSAQLGGAAAALRQTRDEILRRQRFLLTSHARPDGDSIGSQLAMAFALDALGKQVRIVDSDPAPDHYQDFPGMDRIEIATQVSADVDAVIVMECSDLTRAGISGLEGEFLI